MPRGPLARRTCALVAALAAVGAPGAAAPQGGLDLERALALAAERNERAAIAGAEHDAARARVSRARSFFFPDLLATGAYTRRAYETVRTVGDERVTIQSRDALQGTVSLGLAIFDARSIPLYRAAAREEDAVRLGTEEDRRLLAFETADAFLSTIGLEQVFAASERRLEFARRSLQDARTRFEAGLVGSNDVTRAELEVASAERARFEARSLMQSAYLQLGYLLDVRVEPSLEVPESLLAESGAPPPAPETLVAAAQGRRLDLASGRKHAEALHLSAREPLWRAVPSLGFLATTRFTNEGGLSGRDQDWSLGLNMNWPMYDGGERYAERRERRALATIADLEARALLREVDLDVQQAHVALTSAQEASLSARAAVDAARRNAAETTELYRQGLARALEVADASVRLFESEVLLVGERLRQARAFLGLRAATGLDPLGGEP